MPLVTSRYLPVLFLSLASLSVVQSDTLLWQLNSLPDKTDADDILKAFGDHLGRQWGDDAISTSTKHSSERALRIHYAKGSYTKTHDQRGAGFYSSPDGVDVNANAMVLEYDVFFENFGFGIGGKLPGLYGGVTGSGGFACSGHVNLASCFSLRLMWRRDGDGEIYAYIPTNQEAGFKDRDDVIYHSTSGQSLGRGKVRFVNNIWQTVRLEAHLNDVGKTNGWMKLCVTPVTPDNQPQMCYTAENILMRNVDTHHLRGLMFSTFFGGSSISYAAPNDCSTYFKNFKISATTHSPLVG